MSIAENINKIKSTLPQQVKLVAVSKTKPVEMLKEAYELGQRVFGENRPLELRDKHEVLPKDIEWHFIGHPQSKQVKYFAPFVDTIHGIDSLKLLQVVNKEAKKHDRIINCLLQFHIAQEDTKFGLRLNEAEEILSDEQLKDLKNIHITGVMGMATYTDNKEQIAGEFKKLKEIFLTLQSRFFNENSHFCEISMGMSGDYQIAIEQGSTIVRIGTGIFGKRVY